MPMGLVRVSWGPIGSVSVKDRVRPRVRMSGGQ